jgi:hypothetical protein
MDDKQVTIDMSHELAGKTLIFKIKIVGIEWLCQWDNFWMTTNPQVL